MEVLPLVLPLPLMSDCVTALCVVFAPALDAENREDAGAGGDAGPGGDVVHCACVRLE